MRRGKGRDKSEKMRKGKGLRVAKLRGERLRVGKGEGVGK